MDRDLSVSENGGDDNRGQRHGVTPSGSRGSAGLTCATDSLHDLHPRTDQMGRRVHLRQRAVFCGRSRLGGDWKQCQSDAHDTQKMRREEHRLGKYTRATVRYGEYGSGTVYLQTRPQETPPAKANRIDKSCEQIHAVQQRGDALGRRLDRRAPDVQGAPQPMHEESQISRSETPNPHKDIPSSTRERKGHPSSLRSSGRTLRERALVGTQRNREARRPPASPRLTSQVRPGGTAQNPEGGTNEGVSAHISDSNLRL